MLPDARYRYQVPGTWYQVVGYIQCHHLRRVFLRFQSKIVTVHSLTAMLLGDVCLLGGGDDRRYLLGTWYLHTDIPVCMYIVMIIATTKCHMPGCASKLKEYRIMCIMS